MTAPASRAALLPGVRLGRTSPVVDLLEALARDPDALLLRGPDGDVTVARFAALARACALRLRASGVGVGDRVALVADSSVLRLAWQYGTWWIGAVEVSVDTSLRGPVLAHVLTDTEPTLIVADARLAADLGLDSWPPAAGRLLLVEEPAAPTGAEAAALDREAHTFPASALATILHTPGTTGAPKGVMLSRGSFSNLGSVLAAALGLEPGDVGHVVPPFFHVDAHVVLPACLQSGSALAYDPHPLRDWWSRVRESRATWAFVIGAALTTLMAAQHGGRGSTALTRVLAAPVPPEAHRFFEDRLGITVLSMYGQTEAACSTIETLQDRRQGSVGRAVAGFELELHDAAGHPVPEGAVGEIVLRPRRPDLLMLGYWNQPAATLEATRGLWFHTGDLGRLEDGYLVFAGRLTDSVRRRGGSVSVWELEAVLRDAPGVAECAAIGVPDSDGGEDEIKVFVVPEAGVELDVEAFFAYCESSLPRAALPRFLTVSAPTDFVRSAVTGVVHKARLSPATTGEGVHDRIRSAAPVRPLREGARP
ncbi:AMP-binding protein [Nocardioides sp. GY 10127]|uniref:AMP-binding protein n=1 Tax=Nocardioides sp. GY 10127 TaxID=2569762 RepID=UPI001458FE0D|nr:AMP-binding protein [Nocardioides sp. GY 10127]